MAVCVPACLLASLPRRLVWSRAITNHYAHASLPLFCRHFPTSKKLLEVFLDGLHICICICFFFLSVFSFSYKTQWMRYILYVPYENTPLNHIVYTLHLYMPYQNAHVAHMHRIFPSVKIPLKKQTHILMTLSRRTGIGERGKWAKNNMKISTMNKHMVNQWRNGCRQRK